MKKSICIMAIVGAVATALAQAPNIPPVVMQRIGGFLERPNTSKAKVIFVNAQKIVGEEDLKAAVSTLLTNVRGRIELVPGADITLDNASEKLKAIENARAGIFLVENPKANYTVLIAPENSWAVINVSALAADNAAPAYVKARTCKEMVRTFLSLCGGYDSTYDNSLMGPVRKVSDLDKFMDFRPPMDVVGRSRKYLAKIGIDTRPKVTYLQAVKEGWAPAPTNAVQQAIWDKVHALPTEPIKIKPETKKQEK